MKKTYGVEGMSCAHCALRVERALKAVPGMDATVDLAGKTVTVASESDIDDAVVAKNVLEAGYAIVGSR
jgi:P-type Cu+ transporter